LVAGSPQNRQEPFGCSRSCMIDLHKGAGCSSYPPLDLRVKPPVTHANHRRCWPSRPDLARPDLGGRWPSRLVATAEEDRLSFRQQHSRFMSTRPNVQIAAGLRFTLRLRHHWYLVTSGLIHSGDSQIARSSSSSRHESRNCRQRHPSGSPSA
jgi:hypothetical protein